MSEYRDEVEQQVRNFNEVYGLAAGQVRGLIELGVKLGLEAAADFNVCGNCHGSGWEAPKCPECDAHGIRTLDVDAILRTER